MRKKVQIVEGRFCFSPPKFSEENWITASLYKRRGGMFLLSVKMTSSSILEMQISEWPETLI
jgi:hypothetical protein